MVILFEDPLSVAETYHGAGITSDGFGSTEKVTFEATVTDVNQFGYTIETNINGHMLRGLLLSSPASSIGDASTYPNK